MKDKLKTIRIKPDVYWELEDYRVKKETYGEAIHRLLVEVKKK